MKTNLYIPKTIKVGFQNREGTFTGKLAYVIYTDDQGKLRKEKSWQTWRDDKIEPLDFDNEPTSGFMINRNVERYNWGHFSSNRSYIRVHDPRGFEFEVSIENLVGILMSSNCSHRVLEGKFVYSWSGADLCLLPESSEDYGESQKFTTLQANKVNARDLKPGFIYRTKKMEEYMFIGKLPWYETIYSNIFGGGTSRVLQDRKKYVWSSLTKEGHPTNHKPWQPEENYSLTSTSGINHISDCISEKCSPNFADAYEVYSNLEEQRKIVGLKFEPINDHSKNTGDYRYNFYTPDFRPNAHPGKFLKLSFDYHYNQNGKMVLREATSTDISYLADKVNDNTVYHIESGFWHGRERYPLVDEANKQKFLDLNSNSFEELIKKVKPYYMVTEYEGDAKVPSRVYYEWFPKTNHLLSPE